MPVKQFYVLKSLRSTFFGMYNIIIYRKEKNEQTALNGTIAPSPHKLTVRKIKQRTHTVCIIGKGRKSTESLEKKQKRIGRTHF